ncbi:MAG: transcriptional repressor, partial [Candidatus Omnitrophica bacterium]|nr:transcriptional repressor [Candidatus Omnitrophota bacterium]
MNENDFFRQYGIRKTCPRSDIFKIVCVIPMRHFSVEDIRARLKSTACVISRASAYRTINLFTRKGFLHATDLGENVRLYELARPGEHHDHLCCSACGEVIEFTHKGLEAL